LINGDIRKATSLIFLQDRAAFDSEFRDGQWFQISSRRSPCGDRPLTPPDVRFRIRRFKVNQTRDDAEWRG